jgi:hypothetical protein
MGDEEFTKENGGLGVIDLLWLCHSDARQVSDLPTPQPLFHGLRPFYAVVDRQIEMAFRQVRDLPRIGVAEPERVT